MGRGDVLKARYGDSNRLSAAVLERGRSTMIDQQESTPSGDDGSDTPRRDISCEFTSEPTITRRRESIKRTSRDDARGLLAMLVELKRLRRQRRGGPPDHPDALTVLTLCRSTAHRAGIWCARRASD